MKTKLLLVALCATALSVSAQTKGTNTLGLGINSSETNYNSGSSEQKHRANSFNLDYGHFFADNKRIAIGVGYGKNKNNSVVGNASISDFNRIFSAQVSYQKYYPLVKNLYAYAGARGAYTQENTEASTNNSATKNYNLGAMGGLTWFASKRFAFETNLLSAGAVYSQTTLEGTSGGNTNSSFHLQTGGSITNLNFKVYLLF